MGRVKTITIYRVRIFDGDGNELFDQKTAMDILKIRDRGTFNSYLRTLGIKPKSYEWTDLKKMLELKVFLQDRDGGNTYAMYKILKKANQIPHYFALNHIDLDMQFQRMRDIYEAKNPLTGSARYSATGGCTKPPKPQTQVAVGV